jgi:glutathione S-transferase
MKLLFASTSPYSTKVLMAARHLGIEIEAVPTKTDGAPADLIAGNPLGKVPVLLRGDEPPIHDSVAIMHFLDRESEHKLYPRNPERCTQAETLEALCDGITDCLLSIVYERRFRPPENVYQPWIDR